MVSTLKRMARDGEPLVLRQNEKVGKSVMFHFMTETIGAPSGSIRLNWEQNNHTGSEFQGMCTGFWRICQCFFLSKQSFLADVRLLRPSGQPDKDDRNELLVQIKCATWIPKVTPEESTFVVEVGGVDVAHNDFVVVIVSPVCSIEHYTSLLTKILKSPAIRADCQLDPSFSTEIPFDFNNPKHQSACSLFVLPTKDKRLFPDQKNRDASLLINIPFMDFAVMAWSPSERPDMHAYKYHYKMTDKKAWKAFGAFYADLHEDSSGVPYEPVAASLTSE